MVVRMLAKLTAEIVASMDLSGINTYPLHPDERYVYVPYGLIVAGPDGDEGYQVAVYFNPPGGPVTDRYGNRPIDERGSDILVHCATLLEAYGVAEVLANRTRYNNGAVRVRAVDLMQGV